MRSLVALVTAGLTAAVSAVAVDAAKAPVSMTIAANPAVIVYGAAATISGTLSSQEAGEKVSVQTEPCGQSAFRGSGTATTAAGGTWALAVRPASTSQYRARAKGTTTAAVSVAVRPQVTLAKAGRRKYKVRVVAAQSFAGKQVTFQRFRASSQTWTRVRKATLRQVSTGPGATVVSGITFRSAVRARLRVRAVLPKAQAGACYLAGVSNAIRS